MTLRLAIFDVDGTLINSGATICRTMQAAFVDQGFEAPTDEAVRKIIGLSLDEAVARIDPPVPASAVGGISTSYRRQYRPGTGESPLYDGIPALLESLDARGILIAAATGKSRAGLDRMLAHYGMEHLFVATRTADDCPGKPHPAMIREVVALAGVEMEDALMIGDTGYDIEMARNAGCVSIGVEWGYHPVEALRAAGASHVVGTVAALETTMTAHWGLS